MTSLQHRARRAPFTSRRHIYEGDNRAELDGCTTWPIRSAIITHHLRQLLDEPHLAIVGTTRRDGSVQVNPLWYDAEGDRFRFNTSDPAHDWVRHIRRDARATVFVIDPADQYRWAAFQCRLSGVTSEDGAEHVEALALRYTGKPYRWPRGPEQRFVITLVAYRVTGRNGRGGWEA